MLPEGASYVLLRDGAVTDLKPIFNCPSRLQISLLNTIVCILHKSSPPFCSHCSSLHALRTCHILPIQESYCKDFGFASWTFRRRHARDLHTMASQVHALYCFETLSAHLSRSKLPSLADVEDSWESFTEATTAHESLGSPVPSSATPGSASTPSTTSLSSTSTSATPSSTASSTPAFQLSKPPHAAPTAPTEAPLFVTWNTINPRTQETQLRGCIGTFAAQPLEEGLRTYALTAALEDHRFRPITTKELPGLECSVTLLTDFEDCTDPLDWVLGVHGLRISFADARGAGRRYSGTYLPHVATEQGWDQEETLQSLVRKAGWSGRDWRTGTRDFVVTRYQGHAVGVGADTWEAWRGATKGN